MGIVLYEMVTGRVPFTGESPISVAMKHIQQEIPSPRALVDTIPEPLERIILKAVQKNPVRRYPGAAEFLEDLRLFKREGISRAVPVEEDDQQETILIEMPEEVNRNGEDGRGKRKIPWLLIMIIFLSLSLLTGFLLLRSYLVSPEVTVPDIIEENLSEAGAALEELGLRYVVTWATHDQVPSGFVIGVEPRPGRTVRKERVIELTVSEGPDYMDTPDLYLYREMEARVILRELSLTPVIIREHHETVEEGKIFEQVPSAGFPITAGEEVKIYISSGSRPFPIEQLTGKPRDEALEYLKEKGLETGSIRYLPSDYPEGTVTAQYPEAGTNVRPGQAVDLVISGDN